MLDAYHVHNACGVRTSKLMRLLLGCPPESFRLGHQGAYIY